MLELPAEGLVPLRPRVRLQLAELLQRLGMLGPLADLHGRRHRLGHTTVGILNDSALAIDKRSGIVFSRPTIAEGSPEVIIPIAAHTSKPAITGA